MCHYIRIFNAPTIENKAAYIAFIEETINAQLPDLLSSPELFELVKTYQVHILSELNLRRIFPTVCYVNANLPEKRVAVSEKELSELPDANNISPQFVLFPEDVFVETLLYSNPVFVENDN